MPGDCGDDCFESSDDWCVVIVVVIGAKERQEIGSSRGVPFNLPAEEDQAFQRMLLCIIQSVFYTGSTPKSSKCKKVKLGKVRCILDDLRQSRFTFWGK